MEFDQAAGAAYSWCMNAVEFTTELSGAAVLPIPREIAAQLPKSGKARVIVLTAPQSGFARPSLASTAPLWLLQLTDLGPGQPGNR